MSSFNLQEICTNMEVYLCNLAYLWYNQHMSSLDSSSSLMSSTSSSSSFHYVWRVIGFRQENRRFCETFQFSIKAIITASHYKYEFYWVMLQTPRRRALWSMTKRECQSSYVIRMSTLELVPHTRELGTRDTKEGWGWEAIEVGFVVFFHCILLYTLYVVFVKEFVVSFYTCNFSHWIHFV